MPIRNQPLEQEPKNAPEPERHQGATPPPHDIQFQQHQEWVKRQREHPGSVDAEVLDMHEEEHTNNWLIFMVVSIVTSLIVFMLIPWIENFLSPDKVPHVLENIKTFISFSAPVLIIVAALVGAAGYFGLRHVAWFTLAGHLVGYLMFVITIQSAPEGFNFGVYWIVMGSFAGGFLGCLIQFIIYLRKKRRRELLPLLFIGFAASLAAGFFLVRFTIQQNIEFLTYEQVATEVGYQLYKPMYLPEKLRDLEPKIFVEDGTVSVYYGDDHYPPPPIIDFLTGIELVQSVRVDDMPEDILDPEPGVVFVELNETTTARFSERRGRATIEWNVEDTHIFLNIYSNIPAREMFTIARSLEKVTIEGY